VNGCDISPTDCFFLRPTWRVRPTQSDSIQSLPNNRFQAQLNVRIFLYPLQRRRKDDRRREVRRGRSTTLTQLSAKTTRFVLAHLALARVLHQNQQHEPSRSQPRRTGLHTRTRKTHSIFTALSVTYQKAWAGTQETGLYPQSRRRDGAKPNSSTLIEQRRPEQAAFGAFFGPTSPGQTPNPLGVQPASALPR